MTSTSPVPSRAALNALRGVLFTTSCSVFLLAEERRRRLNLARTAIENARKLHTVRTNRGPVALNEDLERRISDLGQEVALGPPKKSHRRRRRDELTNYLLHDPDFEIHKHYSEHDNDGPKSQEVQRTGMDFNSGSIQSQSPRTLPHPLQPPQFLVPSTFIKHSESKRQAKKTGEDETTEAKQETVQRIGRRPFPKVKQQHKFQRSFQDTMAILKRALEDLQKQEVDPLTNLQNLNVAVAALRGVISFKPPAPILDAIIEYEGFEVFKQVVELDPEKIPAVMQALLFRSEDHVQSLYPLFQWLLERESQQGFEQLLAYFTDCMRSRHWMGGLLIYKVFYRFEHREGYKQMKNLYQMLLNAGLFDSMSDVRKAEHKIRGFMFKKAFEAGDEALAQRELEMIRKLGPDTFQADLRIQGRLITREASLGHWDVVRSDLDALTKLTDTTSEHFSKLLSQVTGIFAQSHSAPELESLLRGLMCGYSIPMKLLWVNSILDEYASRHDLDSVSSWLRFCIDHGFKMEAGFMEGFFLRCRKYWSFSDKSIADFCQTLSGSPIPFPSTSWNEDESPRSHDDGLFKWASQSDALECMETLAAREEWEGLCEAYTNFLSSELGFSSSCLRLAVLGWIQRGKRGIKQASSLVREARGQGHDVTKALIPLLMARLEQGDDGHALIKDALRHGVRLHDSIYNMATQTTLAKGDMQGAIDLCQLAAKENGNRDLLYSDYNFANLLFAYTGTGRYGALNDILTRFMSEVLWWKGSPRCKEGIKLAMKATATRAVAYPENRKKHEEALFQLDSAFLHVKKCRTTRRDRWAVREAMVRVVRRQGDEEMEAQPVVGREELHKEIASPSPTVLQAVSGEC